MLRRSLAVLVALVVVFGLVTWAALEWDGVAVLLTRAPDGALRETRVWAVEGDGALWLEAATPERPWYRDVLIEPTLSLARDGLPGGFRAVPVPGEAPHRRLRGWLRERYGWRDAWVALLQDTSRGVAVRLERIE
jgi:hypothetical protein